MDENEVVVAFDIVLEEVEDAIAGLNRQGAELIQAGSYTAVQELLEKANQMTAFRAKVSTLQKEWQTIFAGAVPKAAQARRPKRSRRAAARLARGLRTPEAQFRAPILQALVAAGGSAPLGEVLDAIGKQMKLQLTDYDLQPVPSDPTIVRWRNTAQWTRSAMVGEGLLSSESPRGIWEITPAGRSYLASAQS